MNPLLKLSACILLALAFALSAAVLALFVLFVATFNAWAALVPALGVVGCIYTAWRLVKAAIRAWNAVVVRVVESGRNEKEYYHNLSFRFSLTGISMAGLMLFVAGISTYLYFGLALLAFIVAVTFYAKARAT